MSSSTPWIRAVPLQDRRDLSPTRPGDDDIEPQSPSTPGPFHSDRPSLFYNAKAWSNHNSSSRPPQGLGISSSVALSNNDSDHLVADSSTTIHRKSASTTTTTTNKKRATTSKSKHEHEPKYQGPRAARRASTSWPHPRPRGHTRSGSTIDDLANIAIATSPPLLHASANPVFALDSSPSFQSYARPSTSYINGYSQDFYDRRPAKRIKSERLYPAEFSPPGQRPHSSYTHLQPVRHEDAELLLFLSTNARKESQPAAPELQDPVQQSSHSLNQSLYSLHQSQSETRSEQVPSFGIPKHALQHHETGKEDMSLPPAPGSYSADALRTKAEPVSADLPQFASQQTALLSLPQESAPSAPYIESKPPPIQAAIGTAEQELDIPSPAPLAVKKPRKIKPEVQAEECAACKKMQYADNPSEVTTNWVGCEACKRWFHFPCAGLTDTQEAKAIDKFFCPDCQPVHGPTTYVRKSSRPRTAIDYAGLNEGVVKSSEENTMHHYVPKFKDGSIHYQQDDFARVRPELLTEEFWANMNNMKRPFVVPACWNPRFGQTQTEEERTDKLTAAHDQGKEQRPCVDGQGSQYQSSELAAIEATDVAETVIDLDQDYLDMVMPRNLTVRKVAELYGPDEPVPVIDVKSQETKGKFTLGQWASYYEDPSGKPIRNVISLEVSHSRLGRLIRRPQVVRDIDLEEQVWDAESRTAIQKKPVAYYCLMSVGDSYTDFHIDFGGSSVYYHILKGTKTFFFIPPEDRYLKKYEDWCLSDQQNETWLGDLCNNNVTRVDLHEGDTAFIPAGWIHSVWTPEDSLVVGGNFLTRYDFELQLRVANIEKNTKVAMKYRYPHFQKVMWYTLINYLEEDPVPESLLQEFHDDPDHRFIRANPVWMESADSSFGLDQGEASYNARVYSKSELHGLPMLRDYLYRTARIYADLPVENITKKQIDAVKASVPKGHGDPLQLVKIFAAWCAWKIGNVPVPEWFYTDAGITAELERRQKERENERLKNKPEVFKVPPERVSARQLAQSSATPDRSTTPVEEEPVPQPRKRARTSSGKSSTPRAACDACRKRRIKCKHKPDATDLDETAQETLEKPRTYANVGVDVAKLARASPLVEGKPREKTPEFTPNTDLAEAALAQMRSEEPEVFERVKGQTPLSGGKKRSKACEECRKSKRRCVHDEYGRVDPAKAAEPSKPRGSSTSKSSRPIGLADDDRHNSSNDNAFDDAMDIDAMIDPALMGPADPMSGIEDQPLTITDAVALSTPPRQLSSSSNGGGFNEANGDSNHDPRLNDLPPTPSTIIAASPRSAIKPSLPKLETLNGLSRTPDMDISYSPITTDSAPTESIEKVDPRDRISSIKSALSSAPVRTPEDETGDQSSSETGHPVKSLPNHMLDDARRGSSTALSPPVDFMSVKSRRSSSNTSGTTHLANHQNSNHVNNTDNNSAPVLDDTHVVDVSIKKEPGVTGGAENAARPVSRGTDDGSSELGADEKLARELQAAEHGLRRRASVRAS